MDHHHHHHHHHHQVDLPGFRFHPTEEELLDFYLNNMVFGNKLGSDIIGYLNIYDHHPRALPGLSKIGEREWYFFVPRDRKHGTGGRPNRTTANGFWKATGSDRKIVSLSEPKRVLGLRKTLVFYYGRAPRGTKTDWVMNEYRFPDTWTLPKDIVLCKIYRKATSLKVLEQRAAMEEEMKDCHPRKRQRVNDKSPPSSSSSPLSMCGQQEDAAPPEVAIQGQVLLFKEEAVEEMVAEGAGNKGSSSSSTSTSLQFPVGRNKLPELQVPSKLELDWNTPDGSFWLSPWIPSFTTPPSLGNMLNFYA